MNTVLRYVIILPLMYMTLVVIFSVIIVMFDTALRHR